jgi:hypothetical protein
MKYSNIREEELKNKIAQDYFWIYDCTKIVGNVDFCVCMHQSQKELFEQESLLWAEAKKGTSDIYNSIVQLILTIGKARTFDKFLPPPMLGAFDGEKIALITKKTTENSRNLLKAILLLENLDLQRPKLIKTISWSFITNGYNQ